MLAPVIQPPLEPLASHSSEYCRYNFENEHNPVIYYGYAVEEAERLLRAEEGLDKYAGNHHGIYTHQLVSKNSPCHITLPDNGTLAVGGMYHDLQDSIVMDYFTSPDEAKGSEERLASEFVYLAMLKLGVGRKALILSAPYKALGELKGSLEKAYQSAKALLINVHGIPESELENIQVHMVSEITRKRIPNIEDADDAGTEIEVGKLSPSRETFKGKRYTVLRGILPIAQLSFDEQNNRILGSDDENLGQGNCLTLLLSDARSLENDIRADAIKRRAEILEAKAILDELIVYETEDGRYIVTDGNNRLAQSIYILSQALDGSALGYENVSVVVYREADGITRQMMDEIKNEKQKRTKVSHERAHEGFAIYRMMKYEGKDLDDAIEFFQGEVKKTDAQSYFDTIDYLKKKGWHDDDIKVAFFAVSQLMKDRYIPKKLKFSAFGFKTWDEMVDAVIGRLQVEMAKWGSGDIKNFNISFLQGSNFNKTVLHTMRLSDENRSADHVKLVKDWLACSQDVGDTTKFKALCQKYSDEQRKKNSKKKKDQLWAAKDSADSSLKEIRFILEALGKDETATRVPRETGLNEKELARFLAALATIRKTLNRINSAKAVLEDIYELDGYTFNREERV